MSATTDSETIIKYDPENKPGISNLINIYSSFTNKTIEEIEKKFTGQNYGTFKKEVANVTIEKLEKIQAKYNEIINSKELDEILSKGKEKTRQIAKEKYELVKQRIGLKRWDWIK